MIGSKSSDDKVLLTMKEWKTRLFLVVPVKDKTHGSILEAVKKQMSRWQGHIGGIFKAITADSGSEFADLSSVEGMAGTRVYFAYPYTSCEKGSVERHKGLIRRFNPKGHRIDEYSPEEISYIELWCSSLPRKILGYRTPDEAFEEELNRIYAV